MISLFFVQRHNSKVPNFLLQNSIAKSTLPALGDSLIPIIAFHSLQCLKLEDISEQDD